MPHRPVLASRGAGHHAMTPAALIELLACAIGIILTVVLAKTVVAPCWSLLAGAMFVWASVLMFRMEPRGTVLIAWFMIGRLSAVIALTMIEYGAELPEIGAVGQPGGATATYVAYTALLMAVYATVFRRIDPFRRRRHLPWLTYWLDRHATWIALAVLGFVALSFLALALKGLQQGFPLLSGTDRFLFRRVYADKLTIYLLNFKIIYALVIGLCAFCLPVQRWLRVTLVTGYIALLAMYFMFGDKFFTMLTSLSAFVGPYLYLNSDKVLRRLPQYATIAIIAIAPVFVISYYIYSDRGRNTSTATFKKLNDRMAAQGEIWFIQDRLGSSYLTWDKDFVARNVEALTVKQMELFALDKGLGPNHYSNLYAPDRLRASIHRNAGTVTYTAAFEALGLMAFGYIGLAVFLALVSSFIALAAAYVATAIVERNVISMVFSAYIMLQWLSFSYAGSPWLVISIYSLKWNFCILLIELSLRMGGLAAGTRFVTHRNAKKSSLIGG